MHEKISNEIDLNDIPAHLALKPRTLGKLDCMLDRMKILPSPPPWSLPRDFRGIAELMNVGLMEGWLGDKPVMKLITEFGPKNKLTLGDLQTYFERIDRYDVLDDTSHMFKEDAEEYVKRTTCLVQTPANHLFSGVENDILTIDDMFRFRNGDGPQIYNAFILYVDEDKEFAADLTKKMEQDFGLKICDKDRDLMAGFTFEHSSIMTLISERCDRLLVILSEDFVRSDRHSFFVKYAQFIGWEQKRRKVIPCMYKKCELPLEYRTYVILDFERFSRSSSIADFWSRLNASLLPIEHSAPTPVRNDGTEGTRIEDITLQERRTDRIDLPRMETESNERNYISNTNDDVKLSVSTKGNDLAPKNKKVIISNVKNLPRTITEKIRDVLSGGGKKKKIKKPRKERLACAL